MLIGGRLYGSLPEFTPENGVGRAVFVTERCRSQSMVQRVAVNIADGSYNASYAFKFRDETIRISQPPLSFILCIEIPCICIPANERKMLDIIRLDTRMVMG